MHILHRHILKSIVTTCAASIGLLVFILIVGNALKELLGYLLTGQLPVIVFGKLVLLLIPYVAAFALPMGMLVGVLLVLGRMSGNNEITAMRAAGIGLRYITRPVIWAALAAVVLSLAVNYFYMPIARTAYKQILTEAVRDNPLNFIIPRTFIRDFKGVVVYIGEKDGPTLRDFWVWKLDRANRVVQFAHALSGNLTLVEDQNKMVLELRNVTLETRKAKDPENFSKPEPLGYTDSFSVDLQLDNLFDQKGFSSKISDLTLTQLLSRSMELKYSGATLVNNPELLKLSMSLNERAASALGILAFAVIGVPLGIKVSRKETSANLGVAVALVLIYYFLAGMSGLLASHPLLRPDLLVWIPPLAFTLTGLVLYRRVGRT